MSFWRWLFLFLILVWKCEANAGGIGSGKKKVVLGVDGGTESIRACWFDAENGNAIGKPCAVSYQTFHPQPGWAEQDPNEWYACLKQAVRGASNTLPSEEVDICGMCVDTTCCSVVALNDEYEPLCNSLLWMDARAAPIQTQQVLDTQDDALKINCHGEGPISAEWMIPKALWLSQNQPELYKNSKYICEYQDFINYKLTGALVGSQCNAAARWHYSHGTKPPLSLLVKLGIPDLVQKLPSTLLPMGTKVGTLSAQAAHDLQLPPGLIVAQGGPDAFVGMIGLGCIYPHQYCLITGSSHLHCAVIASNINEKTTGAGMWGAYEAAPLPHLSFAEGGQSSTGSLLRWFKSNFAPSLEYKQLDEEASHIPPGSDGLIALETFQGARTPVTDPLAKGAILGLTLSHTRAHLYRALMEAVCFGTRACMEGLRDCLGTAASIEKLVLAGGIARSPLWLQMHADITGVPIVLTQNQDAPLLGCAILASVAAGIHPSVEAAVEHMVHVDRTVHPSLETAQTYTTLYEQVYKQVRPAVQPIVHTIATLRGGSIETHRNDDDDESTKEKDKTITISPSLLAADWSQLGHEIQRCNEANVSHLHVDVFDGVFLKSPRAFTFGPQMIASLRKCSPSNIFLDVHLCVQDPKRFIQPMAEAGANRIIFQLEAFPNIQDAISMARSITTTTKMQCGVSINPNTPIEQVLPLLPYVNVVNLLAVEPGFGGQSFQSHVLQKLQYLRQLRQNFQIMMDGGINARTISQVKNDADIVVAGSFLFQHKQSFQHGVEELRQALLT